MLKSREVMEEFRGLLNLELPEKKLLNIVFFGLPSLEEGLALDPPLAQRIAVKYHLGSLDAEATENYIKHRLRLAGAKRMLFTREASESVFFFSKGIPRLINTICDNALFEGAMIKSSLIEEPLIQNVCKDLGLDREMSAPQNGGTRASDFVTPHEMQNYGSPPPYQERPAGIIGRRAVDRALPAEPISERRHSPVEMEKVQEPRSFETSEEDSPSSKPLMDEIDGILDNLIDKV
jgi:hypothetical protein